MFIQPAEQIVLHHLIPFGFFTDAKVHAILEIFLHQEQRFIGICGGRERRDGIVAMLLANRVEPGMNEWQCVCSCGGLTAGNRGYEAWPFFECMETKAAFVAKPAFVYGYVTAADGSVDLSIAGCVAWNAAADRPRRMVDAKIAAGAAAATHRVCPLQKPRSNFESEIRTRQRANRAHVHDIHGIRIG